MTNSRTVSQLILEQLGNWGVTTIFGVAGDALITLLHDLAGQDRIRFIACRHEEAAALAASAHAKFTGRPGVCVGTSGPGAVHLLNGLADADMDRVPVLALTGQVESWYMGTWRKQYFDQQTAFRPFVSYTATLAHPGAAVELVTRCLKTAVAHRRVAHLAVPKDLFAAPVHQLPRGDEPYLTASPRSDPEVYREAAARLSGAKQPVMLVGRGCRGAGEAVLNFAGQWGAGVINTLPATGVVPHEHPLALGSLGHAGKEMAREIMNLADMCLVVGATWWPEEYTPSLPVVQLDVEPENIGIGTAVNYGVVGDAATGLPALAGQLTSSPNPKWLARISDARRRWSTEVDSEASSGGSPVDPRALMGLLDRYLADDAVIALDVGDHAIWFGKLFRPRRQEVVVSGKWRTMGFGLPAAIAVAAAGPGRQVVALVGDGGLAMTLGELATAVQYKLALTVIVCNNSMLATEKNRMLVSNLRTLGVDLHNPDFAALARACGAEGYTARTPGEVAELLPQALAAGKPALLDVLTAGTIPPGTKL